MKVPSLNYDQVIRALRRDGWVVVRQRGSHIRLQEETLKENQTSKNFRRDHDLVVVGGRLSVVSLVNNNGRTPPPSSTNSKESGNE